MLHTVDGGASWSPQDAGTSEDLTAITFVSPTSGWAVGTGGVVLHTVDAGATWVPQDSGTTTDLTDVDFVSATEGWTGGEFLHTTTAGSAWTLQTPSATRQDLAAVDFVDLLHGWAVGAAGTIVHTDDAGASWTVQASGRTDALRSVDFVDAWNGWAVGGDEFPYWPSPLTTTILHTGNGGLTWETQLEESDNPPLQDVEFVDSLTGWAVGAEGTILHTENGGETWYQQYTGLAARSVSFISASVGWAAGYGGALVHTIDGGATWEPQSIPIYDHDDDYVADIDFLNETTGWAAGGHIEGAVGGSRDGNLYRTTDGGVSWQKSHYPRVALTSVRFLDEVHGWDVGVFGGALHTRDGGSTWQYEETGAGLLNSVCFASATDGWAVGAGGAILHTVTGGLPDTKPPLTRQQDADSLWYNGDRTVTFSAIDPDAPNSSGLAYTEYVIDDGSWTEGTELTVPAAADHSNDGVHTILFRSRDYADNLEPAQSCQVKIDTAAPMTAMSGVDDTWHATPVTLTLSATDVTSGVATTQYNIDSGSWTAGTSLTVQADGDHAVSYRSVDVAGNVEPSQTVHVKIDTAPPVTAQTGADAAWHNLDVPVTLTATDASGVRETSYSTDGGLTWTVGTSLVVRAPADHSNDGLRLSSPLCRHRRQRRNPEELHCEDRHAPAAHCCPLLHQGQARRLGDTALPGGPPAALRE